MIPCPGGGPQFFTSNLAPVTPASCNSRWSAPSLGHPRGPLEEILSLERVYRARAHLEVSWAGDFWLLWAIWKAKHQSLAHTIHLFFKNSSSRPAPCIKEQEARPHKVRLWLVLKRIDVKISASSLYGSCHTNLMRDFPSGETVYRNLKACSEGFSGYSGTSV